METTIIRLSNGKEINTRGSVSEIVQNYNNKKNTKVTESRIIENITIWINGQNVGEIIRE